MILSVRMIPIFQRLSDKIGMEKMVWRYDPILLTDKYTIEYHCRAFEQIANALNGYTKRCVISFVDSYAKIQKNMQSVGARLLTEAEMKLLASAFSKITRENGMEIVTCAEQIDLSEYGIGHSSCIDKRMIEEIIGCSIEVKKDKNQRAECGCVESIDIGAYNTCRNGCLYCYANYSMESVMINAKRYDTNSPILCGMVHDEDKITVRKMQSLRKE